MKCDKSSGLLYVSWCSFVSSAFLRSCLRLSVVNFVDSLVIRGAFVFVGMFAHSS